MAENNYECMFILDANAYARDPNGAANTIKELIEKSAGKVLASRLWNEQKLAYPIRGRHKGAYWLSYVEMPGANITAFNRACQLTDIIMRHQVIKIDARLIDALVAAAKGETVAQAGTTANDNSGKASAGKDSAAKDSASKDSASKDGAAKASAGKASASKDSAGKENKSTESGAKDDSSGSKDASKSTETADA